MAQYAYKYNDIYDDYVIQPAPRANAAPKKVPSKKPSQAPAQKPQLHKVKKTKKQAIIAGKKKFKIALAKISLIIAMFAAMFLMAAVSQAELESAKAELATAQENYQLCLEQNNQLKLQLDKALEKVDIEKIATEQLGLQKVPDKKKRSIDMSLYQ